MRSRPAGWSTLTLLALALGAGGCTGAAGSEEPRTDPVVTVQAASSGQPARIILSEDAERRLGIRTQPVSVGTAGSGRRPALVIPYAAVVYDADGTAWAFTAPTPRTYVRARLDIRSIRQGRVTLTSGPPRGTEVVTVGAAELVGAEAGISGEE